MARVRFRPPRLELTAELRWLLLATFSSHLPEKPGAVEDGVTLDLALQLGLAPAIGARLRQASAAARVSGALAEGLRSARARSAIRTALHEKTARRIAEVAAQRSIPLVFLKGFALFLAGRDRAGGRAIVDLDLLAPEAGAVSLHGELVRQGYEAQDPHGNEHHLPALVTPEGDHVDLHFCLRGLSFEGSGWATWDDLRARGALVPVEGYPTGCTVPDLDVQTAHLLVHGLAHHVWRPHTYPLLQLVGDLQELLPDGDSWDRFLDRYRPVLLRSLHEPELEALRRLALDLRAGRIPDPTGDSADGEAILLGHILAGYLDESYGSRLRLRHALGRLADAARQGRLLHYLLRKTRLERIH